MASTIISCMRRFNCRRSGARSSFRERVREPRRSELLADDGWFRGVRGPEQENGGRTDRSIPIHEARRRRHPAPPHRITYNEFSLRIAGCAEWVVRGNVCKRVG